ncbi:Uncharacterized membrane protein YfcA [Desulfuromusa kysingii]|uniref:Probable membrane transporter protein n=1 Tax=Desulfuromusa kysingii TaxID=37625 RepID=A0A1H4DWG5_9BACT|nr:sulfite exporter TauE/SafE family protein [Desulfuromusa kysingii]SEA77135.1 Uncharacterized membrane protein YfcA [Desulfuromusa kysingii]
MELLIISILAFVSALVTSVFGFGAGLVLTPLLTFIMPLKDALGIGALIFLVTSGSKLIWYFKDIDWKIHRFSFGLSLIGLFSGFYLISVIDAFLLEKIYAVMLIFFGIKALLNQKETTIHRVHCGYPILGGLFSALVHGGGVFFIRICRVSGLDRVQTVATVAAIHFSINIFKALFFTGSGLVDAKYIVTLAPAYCCAIIGTRVGRSVLKKHVNEQIFSYGIGTLLLLLSVKYLF